MGRKRKTPTDEELAQKIEAIDKQLENEQDEQKRKKLFSKRKVLKHYRKIQEYNHQYYMKSVAAERVSKSKETLEKFEKILQTTDTTKEPTTANVQ